MAVDKDGKNIGERFVKGKSGNPRGRPKGHKGVFSVFELKKAIRQVESRKGKKKFLIYMVEQAYEDHSVLIALARKLLPDLKSVESLVSTFDLQMTDSQAERIRAKMEERFK